MKIKVVKGNTATRLIERYLSEAKEEITWDDLNNIEDVDEILSWDDFAKQATRGVDSLVDVAFEDMPEEVNQEGDIEEGLDEILETVKRHLGEEKRFAGLERKYGVKVARSEMPKIPHYAILIEGDAGSGKTARCKAWCEDHNINLLVKMLASMDETDLGGTPYAQVRKDKKTGEEMHVLTKLPATELDDLERPGSVLFLDEFNRATKNVRNTCLLLINEHVIPDSRLGKGGLRYFPNLLFTIMCINPQGAYNVLDPIDPAERSRVKHVKVSSDPLVTRKYLWQNYQKALRSHLAAGERDYALEDYGRMQLAKQILGSPEFEFDDENHVAAYNKKNQGILNARSFEFAIDACNGHKDSFLKQFPMYCGGQEEKMVMIEKCLAGYTDKDDEMNRLLRQGTQNKDLQDKGYKAAEDDDDDEGVFKPAEDTSLTSKGIGAMGVMRNKKRGVN